MELVWEWESPGRSCCLPGECPVGIMGPGGRDTAGRAPSRDGPPPPLTTLHTGLQCLWLQNLRKPVHRETNRDLDQEVGCSRATVPCCLLTTVLCWDHRWRRSTVKLLVAEFAFVSLEKFLTSLCFSKQFYQSRVLMSALSSKPKTREIAASLSWIPNLPKSGMFFPDKWLLTSLKSGQSFFLDPAQPLRKYFRLKEEEVQEN